MRSINLAKNGLSCLQEKGAILINMNICSRCPCFQCRNKRAVVSKHPKPASLPAPKFHEELTFESKVSYFAYLTYDAFLQQHSDWNTEFARQVWMELCKQANWRGDIEYNDNDAEQWRATDFEQILEEVFVDDAVEKVKSKKD